MREINFLEVGMQNFGPYIDPMILKFDNQKVTMLIGPNGVGKTMSLDAIPFTLYGITSKGAKSDDVVNNKKKKDCHTWVKFSSNEDQFEVHRYQKFKSIGNTVILMKNGKEIKKGHKEVLPEIERILCPAKTFMNTLMFGQKVKDFFTDLTDSDKKQIFRNLLGLDNYVLYYEETKKRISELNITVDTIKKYIISCESVIENINNWIKSDQEKKAEFETNKLNELNFLKAQIHRTEKDLKYIEENVKKYSGIEERIATLKAKISSIVEKLSTIDSEKEKEINDIKQRASAKQNEMSNALTKRANELKEESMKKIQTFRDEFAISIKECDDELEKLKEIASLATANIHLAKSTIKTGESELLLIGRNYEQGICPVCEQVIGDDRKQKLAAQKHLVEVSINKTKLDLEKNIDEYNKAKVKIEALESNKAEYKKLLSRKEGSENVELESQLNTLRGQFVQAKEKIQQLLLKLSIEATEKYSADKRNYEEEHANLNTTYLSAKEEYKDYQSQLTQLQNTKTQITVLTTKYKGLEAQEYDSKEQSYLAERKKTEDKLTDLNKQCDDVFRKINILEFWKDAFSTSGIPSMLVDEAVPFMNRRISEYLDKLTNGRYIVSFDTLSTTKSGEFRDKISVNLLDTYTQANSRVQFSGGQTRIVDIATILTLGDLQANIQNVKFNILLFDEIFDSLDSENINAVAKVLNKIKDGRSIYIISHTHQEDIEVDETLMIGK